jgi:hypothetical protein
MDLPFTIDVFSKDFELQGQIRAPQSATFTVKFNALSRADIVLDPTDPVREFLDVPGSRIRAQYRGEELFSGPVDASSGDVTASGDASYSFASDWVLLQDTLAWVMPNAGTYSSGLLAPSSLSDDAQTVNTAPHADGLAVGSGYYTFPPTLTSPETAVKSLVTANCVTRLGLPVTVVPTQSRGGDARAAGVLPNARFGTVEDVIGDMLAWSGMELRVWHDGGSTVRVHMYEPDVWPQQLTVESGIVAGGKWSRTAPRATRIVVGGPGEDVARAFWDVRDTSGLEDSWGRVVEVFRDATGANLDWPDALSDPYRAAKYFLLRPEVSAADKATFTNYLNAAGLKGLTEGVPTSGLALTLSETQTFHFGGPDGIHLGDEVTVVVDGVPFTDRVTECALTFDNDGLSVVPKVGARSDDPDVLLADSIARLMTAQRRMSTGR